MTLRRPAPLRLCAVVLSLLLSAAAASTDFGDPAINAELTAANGLQNAGNFDAAIVKVRGVLAAHPHHAYALRMLGNLLLRHHEPDRALATFTSLLAIEPRLPQALYGTAAAHAQRHEADAAFAALATLKATRRFDMTALGSDANFADLMGDPRMAPLLATKPADFAHPFVEDVKVIREWDGEAANDQFGWIARGLGDVDGDGVPDFVTSAPGKDIGGANAGRVYVYSTASGKLLWSADGKPGDQLGSGLESAGDTDGDGVQDVIASAPGGNAAYVYSGKDGRVLLTLHGEDKDDTFGNHVASAGDVDRDGHADVLVGAPTNKANGDGAGRAYLYSGRDGRLLYTWTGERAGDNFGSAVAGWSDAAHTLIVIGAPGGGERKTGRVYVYDSLSPTPKFTFDSDASGQKLGYMFLAVLGDVDGDGMPDVYASDWSNGARGPSTGRVYVRSGKDGHELFALTGATPGEGFGTTKSVAGDVDGDGHADLIVGSWQYAGAAVSGGRAYLYSGKDARLLKTYTCRIPGDTFGFDAVALGHAKDGSTNLLITSGWSAVHGFHSGRVFLISSGVRPTR